MRVPRATIDASALRENLAAVREYAPSSKVMAVVKANGYGHGIVATARALSDADALGVARLDEGITLRAAGIRSALVLLEGVFSADHLHVAAGESMQIVVHNVEQIEMLEQTRLASRFEVWLKVDTGMNRLGFRLVDFAAAWQRVRALAPQRVRLMTHLAAAEAVDAAMTAEQVARFESIRPGEPVECSIANSAGLILSERARLDWVRPGIMLYGISPIPTMTAAQLRLRPAMTLATQLISIRAVKAGSTVGYNGIWRATRDSQIGIAAVGYGDGYARNMQSGAPVLVNGHETQVVGRVSMDMTAIDVTGLDARVGDPVTLWGEGLPIERVAPYAGTIPYELVCGINQRVVKEWRRA